MYIICLTVLEIMALVDIICIALVVVLLDIIFQHVISIKVGLTKNDITVGSKIIGI